MEKVYTKSELRVILKEYSRYLKFSAICEDVGISYQAFYQFLKKGNDSALSVETLQRIWLFIKTL